MTITCVYNPPPKAVGSVTITLDETTAQKLKALLGACSGRHFDDLFYIMDDVLPSDGADGGLRLVPHPNTNPGPDQAFVVNLHRDAVFVPR